MKVIGPAYATAYTCHNAAGEVIYVGMTSGITARIGRHKKASPWWHEVEVLQHGAFLPRAEAEQAERDLIVRLQPKHNKASRDGGNNTAIARAASLAARRRRTAA